METTHRTTPEETRERILAAAREVYVRNGPLGATTREIAQLAGVNEVTLFRHFGSKDRLFSEMVERCCSLTQITDFDEESGDVRQDLIRIGLSFARRMERVEDLIRVNMSAKSLNGESPILKGPMRFHALLTEYLRRQIDAGRIAGDADRLTRALTGMIFSHVMGKRFWNQDHPTTEQDIAFYTDIFLKGTLQS
ncbi:MAG: TetR/AcrR family transcriptional regulator [bacterium]|nr:TetR/AcrR family transcriptional regulator [bacterium]